MPKRRWLTIVQAAKRHKSPRRVIDQALYTGTLASTGKGRDRRILEVDVDAMPVYHPTPPGGEPFEFHFTPAEVHILSYSLTVAVVLDRLIGAEPEVIRGLQVKFGSPDEWTVVIPRD